MASGIQNKVITDCPFSSLNKSVVCAIVDNIYFGKRKTYFYINEKIYVKNTKLWLSIKVDIFKIFNLKIAKFLVLSRNVTTIFQNELFGIFGLYLSSKWV